MKTEPDDIKMEPEEEIPVDMEEMKEEDHLLGGEEKEIKEEKDHQDVVKMKDKDDIVDDVKEKKDRDDPLDDVKEIKEEENLQDNDVKVMKEDTLEDKKDLDFLFKSIDCLAAMEKKKFCVGDLVFAKMKGYPAWPARVSSIVSEKPSCLRYLVYFFGTHNSAICTEKNVFAYDEETKAKYGKPLKFRGFQQALDEIQEAASLLKQLQEVERTESSEETELSINIGMKLEEVNSRCKGELQEVRVELQHLEESTDPEVQNYLASLKDSHQEDADDGTQYSLENSDLENPLHSPTPHTLRGSLDAGTNLEELKFLCPVCGRQAQSLIQFNEHKKSHEKKRLWKCDTCGKDFKIQSSLTRHACLHAIVKQRKNDLNQNPSKVHKGNQVLRHNSVRSKHYEKKIAQKDRKQEVVDCNKHRIGSEGSLTVEEKKLCTKQEKKFVCNFCNKSFRTKSYLKIHRHIHTGERPYECKVCGKRFNHPNILKDHSSTHSDEKPFMCNVCGKTFSLKGSLYKHSHTHNDERPFVCSFCDKGFKDRCVLKRHIRIHSGEKPYKCDVCGKRFSFSSSLHKHSTIHSNEKSSICSYCGKGFKLKNVLKQHIRIHSDERPFKCNVCGKELRSAGSLHNHSRTHSDKWAFVCSVCGKGFTLSGNFKNHLRIHSGEKPFQCNVCGKKFQKKGSLTSHALTHSDKRPFQCSVCNRGFKQKRVMEEHARTHTSERPFCCDTCKQSFARRAHLITHIKKNHN